MIDCDTRHLTVGKRINRPSELRRKLWTMLTANASCRIYCQRKSTVRIMILREGPHDSQTAIIAQKSRGECQVKMRLFRKVRRMMHSKVTDQPLGRAPHKFTFNFDASDLADASFVVRGHFVIQVPQKFSRQHKHSTP